MTDGLRWSEDDLAKYLSKRRKPVLSQPEPVQAPSTPKPRPKAPAGQFDPFLALLEAHHLPKPECEFRFIEGRQFRADYAWPAHKLIVERQGGLFSSDERAKRAHAMPLKILRDYEKSNLAQLAGWTYLQYTPEQLDKGLALETIKIRLG